MAPTFVTALAAAAAGLLATVSAQPSCPTAGAVIPIPLWGTGILQNVTDGNFTAWEGAQIVFSPSWIDIVSTSTGLVVDRLCIDAATKEKDPRTPGLEEWRLEGTTLFVRIMCVRVWFDPVKQALTGFGFQREMQDCVEAPMAAVTAFVANPQQDAFYCPWQGLAGSGLEGWGNKRLQIKPLFGYSAGSYFVADRGDVHWTSSACLSGASKVPGTSPQAWQLTAINTTNGDQWCGGYGCCVWAWVDEGKEPVGYFLQGPALTPGGCPSSQAATNTYDLFPWYIGSP